MVPFSGQMTHDDRHWHANDNCFACNSCKTGLVGKPFLPRDGAIFCSTNCMQKVATENDERHSADVSTTSFDDDLKTLSASEKFFDTFQRSSTTTTLASTSLSTTISSKFSFANGSNFELLSRQIREGSPTPSDIALRENLQGSLL